MPKEKTKNLATVKKRLKKTADKTEAVLRRKKSPKKAPVIFKDADADGLPDELEKKIGTNPKKADTDGDGVGDYQEVKVYGTDPLNPDTDGDGLSDGEEIKQGLNPKGPGFLKDLFIPHAGNDYMPKALHPYRLFFYAISSVLLKTFLVGAVILLPIEAWLTPDILAEQSRKIISLTNAVRANLNLADLAESQLLDQAAYNKAADMLLKQYFSHLGPDQRSLADWLKEVKYNFAVAGENLAMGFSSPEEVVNAWLKSQTHYRNIVDPDYTQIGVGMTSGLYHQSDTTLVAQYFGAPVAAKAPDNTAVAFTAPAGETAVNQAEQILGKKTQEEPAAAPSQAAPLPVGPLASANGPRIDTVKSKLFVDQPAGRGEKIVRAEVYLGAEAVRARVNFNDYFIDLKPEENNHSGPASNKWTGQAIIFKADQERIFNPVVLAVISAEDQFGNKATADLTWDNLQPASTSMLKQYYFIRHNQSPYLSPLFDITSVFYKIILVLALLALALNILIEIRRQYPHIILSTLGLICLLVVLIMV